MKAIGIRELRQRASEFLREVEKGETLEVNSHGRPVARLVPIRAEDHRDTMIASGRVIPGRGDLLEGQPLRPDRKVPLPSRALAALRDDER